jgi:hypothetical protein
MKTQLKTTRISASARPLEFSRTETFTEIATTKMTSIVCTPHRCVEVLEDGDGMFSIRETQWNGHSASVSRIWFKPYELAKLSTALSKLNVLEADIPA